MNWFPQPRFMFGSAFHEPPAKAGASSTHSKRCRAVAERLRLREAFGVRPACRRFLRFMVPMHAQKRKEAPHEQRTPERQNPGWERSRDLAPTNGMLAPASHFFFPGVNVR